MDGDQAAPDSASDNNEDVEVVEVDDETLEAMNAPQEGEIDDEDGEGMPIDIQDDSICKFPDHTDAVYDVDVLPVEPYDIFVSGDGDDKAFVWKIIADCELPPEEMK